MEDIWSSIKAYLYERASNPFGVAFVISWFIWNFRVVMIVLSDDQLHSKFHYLDSYFSSPHPILAEYALSGGGYILNSLIAPLVITLIYVFFSPLLSYPVYKFSLWFQTQMLNLKKQSEDLVIITEPEARQLRVKLASLKRRYDEDIDEANKLNDALTEKLSELGYKTDDDGESSEVQTGVNKFDEKDSIEQTPDKGEDLNKLPEVHSEILKFFSTTDSENASRSSIINSISASNISISQALHELSVGKYIYLSPDNQRVRLKARGRQYILDNGL